MHASTFASELIFRPQPPLLPPNRTPHRPMCYNTEQDLERKKKTLRVGISFFFVLFFRVKAGCARSLDRLEAAGEHKNKKKEKIEHKNREKEEYIYMCSSFKSHRDSRDMLGVFSFFFIVSNAAFQIIAITADPWNIASLESRAIPLLFLVLRDELDARRVA